MLDKNKKFNVPMNERKFIKPDIRKKAFKEIYLTYQKKYEHVGMKLLFAYLNTDPNKIVDYIILYKAKDDSGTTDLILYDAVPAFSDRSTPGYVYCKRNNIADKFYEEGIESMVKMSKDKFDQFIELGLHLSLDKNDELYWKNLDNIEDLIRGLMDLSFQFNKKV
jgi:hypothetical protein